MDSRLSSPDSALDFTGTPSTGREVIEATMPGQVGRAPGAGDDDLEAPAAGGLGVFDQPVGRPVGGNHLRLIRNAEFCEDFGSLSQGSASQTGCP